MKNTHIKAGQEVPIELRKEIYREAINYLETDERAEEWTGLCLVLPKILWGLPMDEYTEGGFDYNESKDMFPELYTFLYKNSYSSTNKKRINFLKSVI